MASDVSLTSAPLDLLSGSIKWTGLGSGVDFTKIVDQLVAIERTQADGLEAWKTTWEDKITSLQGLNSRMAALESFCSGFDSFEEFYSRTSSSSDSTVLTATNSSSAVPGSHTIVVGQNIVGRVATRSYQDGVAVGGNAGTQLLIRIGDPSDSSTWQTVTLTEGVDWDGTVDDIDALATAINTKDDAGADILDDVQVVEDKTRGANTYKRLIITAKNGGTDNQLWVEQPAGMDLFYEDTTYKTSIDDPYYETNWNNTGGVDLGKQGTYRGSTNKTFTFMINNTGKIGQEDINVSWADNEGNSGTFVVNGFGTYDVFQGVQVEFLDTTPGDDSDDTVFAADSFTMDAYHTTLQAAQDSGLAQVEQRVHTGFADLITPVTDTDQTFTYFYEGVETDVSVEAGTTLQGLANLINNDSNNRGVQATIINDGTSTTTAYHLVLTSTETGAEHKITGITGTLDNFDCNDSDFKTAQNATNSMIKIDGFPSSSSEYLQRSTNSISDVISGVTLNLQSAGSAVVTVSNDLDTIESQIEDFVSSVNFLTDYINEETKYVSETGEAGTMIGNYTFSIVKSTISDLLFPEGLSYDTDTYTQLSQIGLKTDPDQNGKLIIDHTALNNALNTDLEAVARLFVEDSDHGSSGVCANLAERLDELTDSETGIANILIDNYNGIIKGIDDKIASEEKRISLYEERLNDRFARLEATLNSLNSEQQYLQSQLDSIPKIKGS